MVVTRNELRHSEQISCENRTWFTTEMWPPPRPLNLSHMSHGNSKWIAAILYNLICVSNVINHTTHQNGRFEDGGNGGSYCFANMIPMNGSAGLPTDGSQPLSMDQSAPGEVEGSKGTEAHGRGGRTVQPHLSHGGRLGAKISWPLSDSGIWLYIIYICDMISQDFKIAECPTISLSEDTASRLLAVLCLFKVPHQGLWNTKSSKYAFKNPLGCWSAIRISDSAGILQLQILGQQRPFAKRCWINRLSFSKLCTWTRFSLLACFKSSVFVSVRKTFSGPGSQTLCSYQLFGLSWGRSDFQALTNWVRDAWDGLGVPWFTLKTSSKSPSKTYPKCLPVPKRNTCRIPGKH